MSTWIQFLKSSVFITVNMKAAIKATLINKIGIYDNLLIRYLGYRKYGSHRTRHAKIIACKTEIVTLNLS